MSLCAGGAALAERRRAVVMPPQDELTIEFVQVASSLRGEVLDLGVIAHDGGDPHRTLVHQTVGVRVTQRPRVSGATVVLRAWLESDDGRSTLRIDGRHVGAAPVVIETRLAIGAVSSHRIEIEVPATATAGPLFSAIRWEATTN
jgi:hypothetical protein